MSNSAYYELYRRSTVGVTLADALDTLISDEKIQPQLANTILSNFDRIIADNLKLDANVAKSKLTFKGVLSSYNLCDDVWTLIIKNVIIKMSDVSSEGASVTNSIDSEINVDKFKIVACNSKRAGD
ncbi:transcription initiation factor IIA small chain [Scheffersomyces amazonensis]|uniref:transcription initiation factor IIA small chain n=1 Tax=Scheffersomyces amazonensis TaxID=1078765 RepID=UPI00315CA434